MTPRARRLTTFAVAMALFPMTTIAILFVWTRVDYVLGTAEVTRYIREHQAIVSRRLANPKVHSFSLARDPDNPATLLIRFDVDDKATYLMLEDELGDSFTLRYPPKWETKHRSGEDLGNNWGFAAQGIGELGEFVRRVVISVAVSLVMSAVYLLVALCRIRASLDAGGGAEGVKGR